MQRFESEAMNFILDYEIQHGNEVERVDTGWSLRKLVIVMKKPLNFLDNTEARNNLKNSIKYWESHDPHYAIEEGFSCDSTKESISGPMKIWKSGGRAYLWDGKSHGV